MIHAPVARDVAILGQGIGKAAIVVDALLGTGVRGVLRDPIKTGVDVVNRARAAMVPVLAVDTPTAVDLSSGQPSDPAVRADLTITTPAEDRAAHEDGCRARRPRPRGADRHPAGGRSWLTGRSGSGMCGLAATCVAIVVGAALLTRASSRPRPSRLSSGRRC